MFYKGSKFSTFFLQKKGAKSWFLWFYKAKTTYFPKIHLFVPFFKKKREKNWSELFHKASNCHKNLNKRQMILKHLIKKDKSLKLKQCFSKCGSYSPYLEVFLEDGAINFPLRLHFLVIFQNLVFFKNRQKLQFKFLSILKHRWRYRTKRILPPPSPPKWVHFGGGRMFRFFIQCFNYRYAFIFSLQDRNKP